ncbi:MAG: signal peptidase I [Candidatus Ancillula sp.]|jgi:signal peptidase|nr:signal peptidase I [Candidatus Ancillula sp.]
MLKKNNKVLKNPNRAINKRRRVLNALGQGLSWAFIIAMIGILAVCFGASQKDFSLFGWREYTVLTKSMSPALPVQSVVFVKETKPEDVHIGDIITFVQKDGRIVTHRVVNKMSNYKEANQTAFKTKGDANPSVDNEIILSSNVRGVVRFHVNELGYIFYYISNNLLLVFIIYASLIGAFAFWQRARADKRKENAENEEENSQDYKLLALEAEVAKEKAMRLEAELGNLSQPNVQPVVQPVMQSNPQPNVQTNQLNVQEYNGYAFSTPEFTHEIDDNFNYENPQDNPPPPSFG